MRVNPTSADTIINNRTSAPDESVTDLGVTVSNVVGYNAVGDGVADDTTYVELAIAGAGVGGRVYFPAGTYLVSSAIAPLDGQMWFGDGNRSIIKLDAAKNVNAVSLSGLTDVTLSRLKIDGNRANQTTNTISCLYVSHVHNLVLDQVELADSKGYCLKLIGAAGTENDGIVIRDCYFHGSGQELIQSRATHNLRATGSLFYNWGVDTAANPCWACNFGGAGLEDVKFTITGNVFQNVAATQFAIEGPAVPGGVCDSVISNNVFDGNGLAASGISGLFYRCAFSGNVHKNGAGSWRSGYELWAEDTVVSGNVIDNGELHLTGGSVRCKAIGNVIETSLASAIGLSIARDGNTTTRITTDCDVHSNTVTLTNGTVAAGIGVGDLHTAQVNRISVSENVVRGPATGTSTAGHGVRFLGAAGSTDITITNNVVSGCYRGVGIPANTNHDEVTISGNDVRGNNVGIENLSTGGTYRIARNVVVDNLPAPSSQTARVTLTVDEITTSAVARVTATHGMTGTCWAYFAATNSTPVIDGWRKVVVVDTTHVTVQGITVTGAGNTGTCQPALINTFGYDVDYLIKAGTVSKIEMTTDAGTTWTDLGLTAGLFRLRDGDLLGVTCSSAPTVTRIPRH